MGIPSFYRWLVEKYKRTTVKVKEDRPRVVGGVTLPIDTSGPNPNGMEFDNLYLDMNGIIHPCFHPDGLTAFETYEEVFTATFSYIDRIFSIVRPRKLLFLAIDGVAPRAKMNQQRSRRFRAAKEAADEALATGEGDKPNPSLEQDKKMDSNVITPGTEFMALLSSALRYYIHLKMNQDPGWWGIKVILSDASVPGEGEHKIMSYIRLQRNLPGFDPNTLHCLYGLDADLILLALATHEVHFTILREDARKSKERRKRLRRQLKLKKDSSKKMEAVCRNLQKVIQKQKFMFLKVWVLRKCIAQSMESQQSGVKADMERLIDDFILMCLFVGNDFLPHIPSLEVSEGAVDQLMKIYRKEFVRMGGYLTNSFQVNLERVEHFIKVVGSQECETFRRNAKKREKRLRSELKNSLKQQASKKKEQLQGSSSVKSTTASISQDPQNPNRTETQNPANCTSNYADTIVDKIKLGEEGWKERLYAEKFEGKTEDECEQVQRHAVSKYVEGICWVMRYYYEGVCSWQWFYPYHYAPPASDFQGIAQLDIHFTLGEPFKPFDQLMGVLPAASAHALPAFYRKLMTDRSSPILDFYPTDFEVDTNGIHVPWLAICKLPFIEESRLLSEIAKVENTLTDEERQRNSFGMDILYLHISHPLAAKIISFCQMKDNYPKLLEANVEIEPTYSGGMNGYIHLSDKLTLAAEIHSPIQWLNTISNNQVISLFYKYPEFHPHIPRPPSGVISPEMAAKKWNIKHHVRPAVSQHVFAETKFIGHEGGVKTQSNVGSRTNPIFKAANKRNLKAVSQHIFSERKLIGHKGGVKTQPNVKSWTRKPSEGNKNIDRTKLQNQKSCDDGLNSKYEKFESCTIRKHGEIGVNSSKMKQRSKKSRQSKDDGALPNKFEKFEDDIYGKQSEGETMESCITGDLSKGGGFLVTANASTEMKAEGKSKKRKNKSKKRKYSEMVGIRNDKSSFPMEPNHGVGDHIGANKMAEERAEVKSRKRKWSSKKGEPSKGVGQSKGKKKRKSKKLKLTEADKDVENLKSCIPK